MINEFLFSTKECAFLNYLAVSSSLHYTPAFSDLALNEKAEIIKEDLNIPKIILIEPSGAIWDDFLTPPDLDSTTKERFQEVKDTLLKERKTKSQKGINND